MESKKIRRALSIILCIAMCFSMVSVSAFASDIADSEEVYLTEDDTALSVSYELHPDLADQTKYILGSRLANDHKLNQNPTTVTEGQQSIVSYDELGYCRVSKYNVTYTDASGTAQTASNIYWAAMREILDNTQNTNVTVTKAAAFDSGAYSQNKITAKAGRGYFNSTGYNFHVTGTAWDGIYDMSSVREWSARVKESDTTFGFTDITDGLTAKQQRTNFLAFLNDKTKYMYKYTANKDVTYYAAGSNSVIADHAKFVADGWKLIISSPDLNAVPKESFVEDYQKFFNDKGEWTLKDPMNSNKAIAKTWYMVSPDYNPEKYPYALIKIQYDTGSSTAYELFNYVWYKEAKAGEAVEIPCSGYSGSSQSALKVLIREGSHLSDDLSGTVVGAENVEVDSRDEKTLDVKLTENNKTVSFIPTDDSVTYEISDNKDDFSNATTSYELAPDETSKTLYLKISAPAGNSVIHTINASLSTDVNGVVKVGEKTLSLSDKKTKYFLTGVSVGDAISFDTNDQTASAVVSDDAVSYLPQRITVNVTAASGRTWEYEVILSEEDIYKISDLNAIADGTDKVVHGPIKIYPKGEYGITSSNMMTAEQFNAITDRYGALSSTDAEFWAGTDGYRGYPGKNGKDGLFYIDSPASVDTNSTSAFILNGESYVFKHTKLRMNNSDYYSGGVGKYDGTDGHYYITFNINRPGTMYIFDKEGKGAPNAVKEGFAKVSGVSFAGSTNAYAKHYDVADGETATVNIPSYGWDSSWGGTGSSDRSFYNSSNFVFVFDADRDTALTSVSYSGAVEGEFNVSTNMSAQILSNVNGEVIIKPQTKTTTAKIYPEEVKVNVVNGAGVAEFMVISGDKLAATKYTVTFTPIKDKMIYDATKGFGVAWIDGIYGTESDNSQMKIAAIDFVPATGTKYAYMCNRSDLVVASKHSAGMTYLRMPKNEGTSYKQVTVKEGSKYTVKIGDNDPVEYDSTKSSGYNGSPKGTIRYALANSGSPTLPFFSGAYNGTDGKWYMTFKVSSDCRVVIADKSVGGYPNLDKDKWTFTRDITYVGSNYCYYADFKAGDTVCIPNYGLSKSLLDTTPVVITYTDANGNEQIINSTVASNTIVWDGIYVGISWDAEKKLTGLMLNGEAIEGFDSAKTSYDVELDSEELPAITYTAEEGAEVTVANGTFADGKATSTVTVENAVYKTVYTINFTVKKQQVTFNYTAIGGSITANGETNITSGTYYYDFGSTVKLVAVPEGENEFLYWKDAVSKAIISTDTEIEVTAGTARSLMAIFKEKDAGFYVSFYANGRAVAEGLASVTPVPQNPYVAGYEFAGWYVGDDITEYKAGDNVEVEVDTQFVAKFRLLDTKYTVSVDGEETQHNYNEKISVTAKDTDADGKVFTYWTRDGVIVSYNKTYSFFVDGNTNINAVYADTAAEEKIVIVMAQPGIIADGNRISFYSERSIPTGYTVKETGIILSKNDDFDVNSATIKAVAKSKANKGQYTIRKANAQAGETWYGMAYVIVEDASGNVSIEYSNKVSKTFGAIE